MCQWLGELGGFISSTASDGFRPPLVVAPYTQMYNVLLYNIIVYAFPVPSANGFREIRFWSHYKTQHDSKRGALPEQFNPQKINFILF